MDCSDGSRLFAAAPRADVMPPEKAMNRGRRRQNRAKIRTIRTKLIGYAAVVLFVPLLMYGTLAFTTARATLTPALRAQLAHDTAGVKIAVQELLAGQIQNVRTWAHLDIMAEAARGDRDGRISRFLEEVTRDYGVFLDLFVLDSNGVCVASSWHEQIGKSYSTESSRFLGDQGRAHPDVAYSADHGAFYLGLAAAINYPDESGARLGTILAMLDRAVLDAIVQPLPGNGNVDLLLVNADRRILAGPSRAYLKAHLPLWQASSGDSPAYVDGTAPLVYSATSSTNDVLMISEVGLEEYRALPDLDWSVIAALPRDVALAPILDVRKRIFLLGSLVGLIGLILARALSSNISRPIKELTSITKRIAHEGALERIPDPSSEDEIGDLTRSFQTMVENVSAAHHEVVHASKLAFIGELSAGIAHDIRTPLGIIKNSAQLLERRAIKFDDTTHAEFARFILEESDRLSATVDGLLDYARPAKLEKEDVDINATIQRTARFLSSEAASKGVDITVVPDNSAASVMCDAGQVYQVTLNLVVNAIQACEPGGTVEIRTHCRNDGVEIVVADTGCGISEDIRDSLFTPFVSKRKGGIGLGLAIVQRIIAAHGGKIEATNRRSGGARFRAWIPSHNGLRLGEIG